MATRQQKKLKILLIGDTCTDVYQYGIVERISPEAPVPVFKLSHQEEKPGMAGNVQQNLLKFGFEVFAVTGAVSTKTRLIDMKSKQHIVRIDADKHTDVGVPIGVLRDYLKDIDAVVVSDYNKGMVSYELLESIVKEFPKLPVFVDTKKTDLARLEGCFVKINNTEFNLAKSIPTDLIVTLGDLGARYKDTVYPAEKIEVTDVTGAGDTFLAALTYQYLKTKKIEKAIEFAIKASSVTVQHIGVYAPSLEEIA